MTASFHFCGTFPSRQMRVGGTPAGWSDLVGGRVSAVPRGARPAPMLSRVPLLSLLWQSPPPGLDPEGTRDWLQRQPLRYVGIEHFGFRVQQRTEQSHPSLADMPFVAQQSSSLVTDTLWFDLLRLLQLHRFDVLEESMLVSHTQLLRQLNDVALEKTNNPQVNSGCFCTELQLECIVR